MKVYFDNDILSGIERGDLKPEEMAAVSVLSKAQERGQIEIYTSRLSWVEQERTPHEATRLQFRDARGKIEVINDDHRVEGFSGQEDPSQEHPHHKHPRFAPPVNPMVTDILDEPRFSSFRGVGLRVDDAKHLTYAVDSKLIGLLLSTSIF